jgi:parvulin-like peptidyl-prolyl isomerase
MRILVIGEKMKSMAIFQSLAVVALAHGQDVKPTPAPAPLPAISPAKSPAPAAEDKILARVGTKVIRESDFQKYLTIRFPPQQLAQISTMAEVRDRLRNEYLDSAVLVAKARREGMDKTDEYKQNLAVLEMQALLKAYMQKENEVLMKQRQVSDEEIQAFYNENKASFKTQDTFSARHILVKVKGGANGNQGLSDEEAKARILKAKEELAKGRTWEDVAKEYSEDPGSKDKGGLYENKRFGEFVKEFDAAVKAQVIGKPGDPVKSQWGYHLIQVEKLTPGEIPSLDKVKEQVRQKAMAKKTEQVWKDFISGLKKEVGFVEGQDAAKPMPAAPAHHAPKKASTKAKG